MGVVRACSVFTQLIERKMLFLERNIGGLVLCVNNKWPPDAARLCFVDGRKVEVPERLEGAEKRTALSV
jgi:hypothetical protein